MHFPSFAEARVPSMIVTAKVEKSRVETNVKTKELGRAPRDKIPKVGRFFSTFFHCELFFRRSCLFCQKRRKKQKKQNNDHRSAGEVRGIRGSGMQVPSQPGTPRISQPCAFGMKRAEGVVWGARKCRRKEMCMTPPQEKGKQRSSTARK